MVRFLHKSLFKGADIIYLPKDQVIQLGYVVERGGEVVLPSQIVEYFIEHSKYHWVMNFCICRAAEKCKKYPIETLS